MENDPTMTAGLLAIALALVKVMESLVSWVFKKMSNGHGKTVVVELGPEATRMIRESHEKVGDIHSVISRTNQDGVPLIYGPRQEVHQLAAAVEGVGEKVDHLTGRIEDTTKKK